MTIDLEGAYKSDVKTAFISAAVKGDVKTLALIANAKGNKKGVVNEVLFKIAVDSAVGKNQTESFAYLMSDAFNFEIDERNLSHLLAAIIEGENKKILNDFNKKYPDLLWKHNVFMALSSTQNNDFFFSAIEKMGASRIIEHRYSEYSEFNGINKFYQKRMVKNIDNFGVSFERSTQLLGRENAMAHFSSKRSNEIVKVIEGSVQSL